MIAHWFRADLRLSDNPGLSAAAEQALALGTSVGAVYVATPAQWRAHDMGDARIDFEYRTLCMLADELTQLGFALSCLFAGDFAQTPQRLLDWCQAQGVTQLHVNRQYEFNEIIRDRAVHRLLRAHDITVHWYHDQGLTAPEQIRKSDGGVYSVFTPYKSAVRRWLAQHPIHARPRPESLGAQFQTQFQTQFQNKSRTQAGTVVNVVPALPKVRCTGPKMGLNPDYFWGDFVAMPHIHALYPVGEAQAQWLLEAFCQERLAHYPEQRDVPSIAGTSGLSAHLAVGAVSAGQCWVRAQHAFTVGEADAVSVEKWGNELIWRDFYRAIMVGFPHVGQGVPFKRETLSMRWRDHPDFARLYPEDDLSAQDAFDAWCSGQTGYPLIDAAMRCLNATHTMHNRLRMVCAMFLVKDLHIDWRWGERYFARMLVDFDYASNNGGWQWSASTGNDAVPYFRIFNPTTQSQNYDAQGVFIRQWVPELQHCPVKHIHAPAQPQLLGYAPKIVDHAVAREQFLSAWKTR